MRQETGQETGHAGSSNGRQPHPKASTAEDKAIGSRIRLARKKLRMAQGQLGERIGVSFQQIQKYENGINRIGAARLVQTAETLGVSTDYLLRGDGPAQLMDLAGIRRELGAAASHLKVAQEALAQLSKRQES